MLPTLDICSNTTDRGARRLKAAEYLFISKDEFSAVRRGDFLEYANVHGHL